MSRRTTIAADVEAVAHLLFSHQVALDILGALGQGEHLDPGTLDARPQAISDAVAVLTRMGLVNNRPDAATVSDVRTVSLTPRGRSLAELL